MNRKRLRRPLLLMLLLCLAAVGLGPGTLRAQEGGSLLERLRGQPAQESATDTTVLRVWGAGAVPVTPDRAQVTLGVESRAASAAEALRANSEALVEVLAALGAAGVATDSLRTGTFTLQSAPPGAPGDDSPAAAGYSVANSITIDDVDPNEIGRLIEVAVAAGANQVQGLQFMVADPALHRAAALRAALLAASADASTLAEALGGRITRILEVRTQGGPALLASGAASLSDGPPLLPGQATVEAAVELVVEIVGARQPEAPRPTETPRAGATIDRGSPARLVATATLTPTAGTTGAAVTSIGATQEIAVTESRASGIPFVTVAQADNARYRGTRARALVVTSAAEWQRLAAPLLPAGTRLSPDYGQDVVVVAFLGQRPGPGFAVTVRDLQAVDGLLSASVEVAEPGETVDRSAGPTSPFHILTIQRADLPPGLREPLEAEVLLAR